MQKPDSSGKRGRQLEELLQIQAHLRTLPRFRGQAEFNRKIKHAIRHLRLYRESYGDLLVKEARKDLEKARAMSDAAHNQGKEQAQ